MRYNRMERVPIWGYLNIRLHTALDENLDQASAISVGVLMSSGIIVQHDALVESLLYDLQYIPWAILREGPMDEDP